MIQRIQSIWLLLAAITACIMYIFPLWSGTLSNGEVKNLFAAESLLFLALNSLIFILALVGIFLFKNRGRQKFICVLGIILSAVLVALEYDAVNNYKKEYTINQGAWAFCALAPFLMIIFFFFAYRGISKDESMLKEGDRLR
ncbi:MAG: DUF4293 domain-containing protein [Chitinophagaceae bacterium]